MAFTDSKRYVLLDQITPADVEVFYTHHQARC